MTKQGKILAKIGPVYEDGNHGAYIAVFTMHAYNDGEYSFPKETSFSVHLTDKKGKLVPTIWKDGLYEHFLENLDSLKGTEIVLDEFSCKDRKEKKTNKEKWRATYARIATGKDKEFFREEYGVIS